MKRQIIFNLDEEVVEWLKTIDNRSALANQLFIKEKQRIDPETMPLADLIKLREEIKLKEEYENKLKEVKNGSV